MNYIHISHDHKKYNLYLNFIQHFEFFFENIFLQEMKNKNTRLWQESFHMR